MTKILVDRTKAEQVLRLLPPYAMTSTEYIELLTYFRAALDAPEIKPSPETHCPHGADVYEYCKLCDMREAAAKVCDDEDVTPIDDAAAGVVNCLAIQIRALPIGEI